MEAKKHWILVGLLAFCFLGLMLKASPSAQPNKPTPKQLKNEFQELVEQEIEREREHFEERKKELERLKELAKDPNSLVSILLETEFVSPLRALKGVMVRVSITDFERAGRRLGFATESEVQDMVRRLLKEAGIKVFDEWTDIGVGQLLIEITARKTYLPLDDVTLCQFCVCSSLLQAAQLVRDPNIRIANQTWKAPLSAEPFLADSAGFSGSVKIGTRVGNVVALQTGDFIEAYLAANPKEHSTGGENNK